MNHWRIQELVVAAAICSLVSGCDRRQVRSYTIDKEQSGSPNEIEVELVNLPTDPPQGWQQLPASGMRKASYRVPLDSDASSFADVSVVSFPGTSGGLLANVNRWRLEVSLDEVGEEDLDDVAPREGPGDFYYYFVDLYSDDLTPEQDLPKRILGAMLPLDSETWFVKMVGPVDALALERERFREFVSKISVDSNNQGRGAALFATNEPVNELPRITYNSPDGWVEKETTTMRVASFSITKEGLPPADLSVIPLEGTGGGMLINIGQWRQQLGLAPIADEAMSSLIEEIDDGERVFRIVDLVSEKALLDGDHKARMLAAYLPTGGYAWFFKMVGEDSLVAAEKEAFIQFLKSARFPTQ